MVEPADQQDDAEDDKGTEQKPFRRVVIGQAPGQEVAAQNAEPVHEQHPGERGLTAVDRVLQGCSNVRVQEVRAGQSQRCDGQGPEHPAFLERLEPGPERRGREHDLRQGEGDPRSRHHAQPGDRPQGHMPVTAADEGAEGKADCAGERQAAQDKGQGTAAAFGRADHRSRTGGGGGDDAGCRLR